jgi:hypothetical protein
MRAALIAVFCSAVLALQPATARADAPVTLSVCNGYNDTIYYATGWRDATGWHSQGWWTLDPDKCITQPITAPALYYHWESAQQTNCICPPPIANPQDSGGVMLDETGAAFNLNNANQPQGSANLAWFNQVLFTSDNFPPNIFTGVEKLIVQGDGTDSETLYLHQQTALMPLP